MKACLALLLMIWVTDTRADINLVTDDWKLQVVFALVALIGVLIVFNWKKFKGFIGVPADKDGQAGSD